MLKETYFLIKNMGMGYEELLFMPIYKRRFFLNEFIQEKINENNKNNIEKQKEDFKTTKNKIEQLLANKE